MNSKNNQTNILVLSFIPDQENESFLTPILDYLGGHYDDAILKFKDFGSRYHLFDMFAKMYQGQIDISGENPFIKIAAQNIDHARVVGDPFVVIDYHHENGHQCVITILMPNGLGYVNSSITVPAESLAGSTSYVIANSAIQAIARQKDHSHKWTKELGIPVVYYFKDKTDGVDFGYSRGCRRPRLATVYGAEYINGASSILEEIEDIKAIYSNPVPSGSIGEDTFQDYLFTAVNDASENKKPLMVVIESQKDDSALDDLGLLDIYLISANQVENKKFSISYLESMAPISAASHVMKILENR